jgi:septation ring formation regulator EzrA
MTQVTDTDLKEIKDLITAVREEMRVGFSEMREEMRVGFSDINGELKTINTRLTEVEKKIDKQDTRLWAFGGIVLTAALGGLWKLLG